MVLTKENIQADRPRYVTNVHGMFMLGFVRWESIGSFLVVAIGDSWIVGYLDGVKSLGENGILCVHVTGYKRGDKLWHIIQGGIWYKLGYKQ